MTGDIFDLKDKVVVVTGGLGQLGRQFAVVLAQRKAKVAVLDVKREALAEERFSNYIKSGDFLYVQADVTKRGSLKKAMQKINKALGFPYGLINNAAFDSPPGSSVEASYRFEDFPEAAWDKIVDVNLKGVFLCCQVFGSEMAKQGLGSIINISSIYGLVSPDQRIYEYRAKSGKEFYKPVSYSVTKSGLLNLTRYLATYWADKGVRVNTLTLGGVFNNQDKRFLKGYSSRVPLGRMAREDEYNGAVIFLLSGASSYMTGSNLIIDGGWTAW